MGSVRAQTGIIYTCVDREGRRHSADRLIADCLDREQRELGPTGLVRRQIGPAFSDQERAAFEAQRRKDAEAQSRAVEERRRERALLTRYPDKAAHDAERAAAIERIDEVTASAGMRLSELQSQRKEFDVEMAFYKAEPGRAPQSLLRKIAGNEDGVAEQQRFLAARAEEKERVHLRFDAELAQLRRLWDANRSAASTLPSLSMAQ